MIFIFLIELARAKEQACPFMRHCTAHTISSFFNKKEQINKQTNQ